jgi:hypothetical protein
MILSGAAPSSWSAAVVVQETAFAPQTPLTQPQVGTTAGQSTAAQLGLAGVGAVLAMQAPQQPAAARNSHWVSTVQAFGLAQAPWYATATFAHAAAHELPYVLPSTPQTGA